MWSYYIRSAKCTNNERDSRGFIDLKVVLAGKISMHVTERK